jgi:hypothetical protein
MSIRTADLAKTDFGSVTMLRSHDALNLGSTRHGEN